MATQCGVTLIKRFPYRGDANEEFSNTYHFTGDVPANPTDWKALYDALIAQEKTLYLGTVSVVRAYGYDSDADDAVSVDSYDYLAHSAAVAGTMTTGSDTYPAGDQAAWVRWTTSRRNSNGKLIYLRKYFHGAPPQGASAGSPDSMHAAWVTAALAFGAKLSDGSFLDARTITARGHTDVITAHAASLYITIRQLKRRGKRPGS